MSGIRDLIAPSSIRLDVPADDWRSAIRTSGDLLASAGAIDDAYTDAMIASVEENGPYIVIAPGFALAHARPDTSVHRTAMSVARLAAPVAFGHESNDPVTLVMGLAAADDSAHREALAALATILADPGRRALLDEATTAEAILDALDPQTRTPTDPSGSASSSAPSESAAPSEPAAPSAPSEVPDDAVPSKNFILTVCGNGVGTSLFLKNTTEQVLGRWGWSPFVDVEATDTISAKGRAKEADMILTSAAIAQTLGDLGVPVHVIENFTSTDEVDAVLRRQYVV